MNEAHFHLVVNHLPIVGVIIGTLVLLAGLLLRKDQVKLTAAGVYVFSAITAVVANVSGEGAEEIVEELPGMSHKLIHEHEEQAELFFMIAVALGVLSLIVFFLALRKNKLANYGFILLLLVGAGAVVTGKNAGTSGGEISHPEIRTGADVSTGDDHDDHDDHEEEDHDD